MMAMMGRGRSLLFAGSRGPVCVHAGRGIGVCEEADEEGRMVEGGEVGGYF